MIDTKAQYKDNASKDGIVYHVEFVKQFTIRLRDDKGNYLTVGHDRFNNDFTKVG